MCGHSTSGLYVSCTVACVCLCAIHVMFLLHHAQYCVCVCVCVKPYMYVLHYAQFVCVCVLCVSYILFVLLHAQEVFVCVCVCVSLSSLLHGLLYLSMLEDSSPGLPLTFASGSSKGQSELPEFDRDRSAATGPN